MSQRRQHSDGNICCVVKCRNNRSNTENIKFYSFSIRPHKAEQREKWIKAVRRINPDGSLWEPNKYSKICSAHFIGNAKSEHPLSPSFLPTIFPSCYMNNPSEKFIRSTKRRCYKRLKSGSNQVNKPKAVMFEFANVKSEPDLYEPMTDSTFKNSKGNEELPPEYIDVGVQANILSEQSNDNCNLFVCNSFMYDGVCEVQTQANL